VVEALLQAEEFSIHQQISPANAAPRYRLDCLFANRSTQFTFRSLVDAR
jgi:hypothetical protein